MRVPSRTSDSELRELAIDALAKNVGPVTISTNSPFDLVVDVDGQALAVELKTTAYGTVERFAAIKRLDPPRQAGVVLLVGRRINAPARAALEREGWGYLDAESGALYLQAPGIRIDTMIEPVRSSSIKKPVGIIGRAGKAVAYELLRRTHDRDPNKILTSSSKGEFDVARSSTSDALRALAAADLITGDGQPVLPELFWELAKIWAPVDRRWLATTPDSAEWGRSTEPGKQVWHLGGVSAAVVHGAPAVGVGPGGVDLYVPGPVVLSIASRRYGAADPIAAAASVSVPAAHQVTRPTNAHHTRTHLGWRVVHPVAAALDLAALGDARSQQVLAEWQPDGRAVWHDA